MKFMKPVLATLVAAGLVSPVYAAYHSSGKSAHKAVHHNAASASSQAKIYSNSPSSDANAASWKNRFTFGATATYGYSNTKYGTENAISGASLINANLFVDATVANDVEAHMNMYYNGVPELVLGTYPTTAISLDEAYLTVRNVGGNSSPVYVRAGLEYVPFGRTHNVYAFLPSLTQMFTLHQEHALQLGYVDNSGLSATVYAYKDALSDAEGADARNVNKFGLNVAYANHYSDYDYDLSVGYLNDFRTMTSAINSRSFAGAVALAHADSAPKAGIMTIHAGTTTGPFGLSVDYTALSKELEAGNSNSKVAVWGFDATYKADMAGMNSMFDVAYETTSKGDREYAAYKSRWAVGYDAEVFKHAHAKLEYATYRNFASESEKAVNTKALLASLRVDV